ncbi:MAG: GNAT family N-acetyltransferase, partial [Chloroflexi bacterium]|nr:GNAT family N-acetyltransferase [Chloroflexota bacterium]
MYHIAPLTGAQVEAAVALWDPLPPPGWLVEEEETDWREMLTDLADNDDVVALCDDQVRGLAVGAHVDLNREIREDLGIAAHEQTGVVFSTRKCLEIHALEVHPDHRRQGLGRALVQALLAQAP